MSQSTADSERPADAALPTGSDVPLYRQILSHLDTAVAVVDAKGMYVEHNHAHRDLLGYGDDELLGESPAIYLGPDAWASVMDALATEGAYSGEVECTTRDGRRLRLGLKASGLWTGDGDPAGAVIELHHGDRAQIEDTPLNRTVSLLRATLDSTADGLLVVDRSGRIVRFNRRFAKMWRLPPQILATRDDARALQHAVGMVRDPEAFLARVKELYDHPEAKSFDVIHLRDGRVFERYSRPQRLATEIVGRVWSFRDVTFRAQAEAALRESETRYRRLFEESRHAIYLTTREGYFVDANTAALRLFGLKPEDLARSNARDFYVFPEQRAAFQDVVEREGGVTDYPVRLRSEDGREMDCVLTSTVSRDRSGQIVGYQGIIEDVTERRATERALRASEQKFRSLIEHASDTITVLDANGTIKYESPSLIRVLGYKPEDLIGRAVFEFLHPDDIAEVGRRFQRLITAPERADTMELRFQHTDGSWRVMEVVGRNLLDDEAVRGIIINARDVTERKLVEERLVHDAFHDKLTQLPNRALFMDRVAQLLQRGARSDAASFAVLFLDVDRFKVVNDSLGHMIGDQLLVSLARRLGRSLRPGDTVARMGGDEFTMILDGADAAEAAGVAERIHRELKEPFRLGPHQVYTTVSIGIAMSTTGYRAPEEMLRDADVAMYRAKESGRARHVLFDTSMRASAVALLELETDLRRALELQQFEIYYQPIVQLDNGQLHGFEALLRWRHGKRGLLQPGEFLETAEDTGLIVPIGWWVLETVSEQLARWSEMQGPLRAPPVQVNVSASQLKRAELVYRLDDALRMFGTPAHLLHLELTESTMMENAESTVATLHELKKLEVGLSIDDFGTGYSSLSYLHRFPTDSVKIDRTFVTRMGAMGRDAEIVRTIVDLAHDLGMYVVAEGVENESHVALLRGMRCEYAQGFRFSRPLTARAATELLLSRPTW